jgi:hypothetical protein
MWTSKHELRWVHAVCVLVVLQVLYACTLSKYALLYADLLPMSYQPATCIACMSAMPYLTR